MNLQIKSRETRNQKTFLAIRKKQLALVFSLSPIEGKYPQNAYLGTKNGIESEILWRVISVPLWISDSYKTAILKCDSRPLQVAWNKLRINNETQFELTQCGHPASLFVTKVAREQQLSRPHPHLLHLHQQVPLLENLKNKCQNSILENKVRNVTFRSHFVKAVSFLKRVATVGIFYAFNYM